MIVWRLTQVVAAAFWFNGQQTVRKTADCLGISEECVAAIRKSDEYREEVKALMIATRSQAKLKAWINTYLRENVSIFSKRMGLEPDVVEKLIEDILSRLP